MRDSATYLTNSEIAILFIRSAIKHSIPEEPIACQRESSFLRKRIPDSCGMSYWNCNSVCKICD